MILLLLLGACFCVGLSDGTQQLYGDSVSFKFISNAASIEFTPLHNPDERVMLWKQDDPGVNEASRGHVVGNDWVMDKLTQEDSGYYTFRGHYKRKLYAKTIIVSEHTESYEKMVGQSFTFSFDLPPAECDLTFFPGEEAGKHRLVREGAIVSNVFDERIQLRDPDRFDVLIDDLTTWDSGRFELTDKKGNLALVVHLKVLVLDEESAPLSRYVGWAAGFALAVFLCRCCLKCCCSDDATKTDESGSPTAAMPDVYNHEEITQPTGPRCSDQPIQSYGTTDPSPRPGPLAHYQPASQVPPPYPEFARVVDRVVDHPPSDPEPRGRDGAGQRPAPAPFVPCGVDRPPSDPEPRFELKGVEMPSLSSDSTHCDVYTSDKLNFF